MTVALMPVLVIGCTCMGPSDTRCRGNTATITHGPGYLRVVPECLSVNAGETVTLILRPSIEPGKAETRSSGKNDDGSWLDSTNSDPKAIRIVAPENRVGMDDEVCNDDYCEYKFDVVIDGVGTLDPRVRVNF